MFRFFEKCHIFSVYVNPYSVKYMRFFDSKAGVVSCVPAGGLPFLFRPRKEAKKASQGGAESQAAPLGYPPGRIAGGAIKIFCFPVVQKDYLS